MLCNGNYFPVQTAAWWADAGHASPVLPEKSDIKPLPDPVQLHRVVTVLPTAIMGNKWGKKKKIKKGGGYFGILTSLWPGERLNSHDSLAAERQHFVARILGNAEGSREGVSLIFKGGSQAPV